MTNLTRLLIRNDYQRRGEMSKSKGNVVNPDELVEHYGADSLRMISCS